MIDTIERMSPMTMTTTVAQMRISREIQEAEAALDTALIKQSQLFTAMVAARRETGVAAFTGQDALVRLARSQQNLLEAGGDLAKVHYRMRKLNQDITGDLSADCPGDGQTGFSDQSQVA
jgi:hypothetical protein